MFCTNCGANIPDDSTVCPSCGVKIEAAPQPQAPMGNFNQAPMNDDFNNGSFNQQPSGSNGHLGGISLALGIVGIVGAVLFGAMFGVPAAIVSMIISICGLVLAIMAKKQSGGKTGNGGFVCSIIGCAMGFVFTIGCAACGASINSDYGCYGCVGGPCKVSSDVKNSYDDFERELNNALSGIDWDAFN